VNNGPLFGSCEPGERIANRYEIVRRLGKGGMGHVYLAADLRLGRKLRAVKLLRPAEGMAESADAELRMLLRVNHPRLPQIVDYVPPEGLRPAALVTDFAEGENLAAWFDRCGRRIHPRKAIEIGRQLCEALTYLHELTPPIVHRDIKPANVMIDGDGFIRLIDLGIARLVKQAGGQDTMHLGTPGFAAPEQGGPHGHSDGRSDLYGLGALLYYLLSGGRTPASGAPDIGLLADGVPSAARDAVACLLQADPGRRPADAKAAERMLAGVLASAWSVRVGDMSAGREAAADDAAGRSPHVVAVASYAPGAGATFVAITLGRLLASSGTPCTIVEHPLLEPRLFAMLATGTGPGNAAGREAVQPLDKRYIGFSVSDIAVQALHPDRPLQVQNYSGQLHSDSGLALRDRLLAAHTHAQTARSEPGSRHDRPVCIVDLSGAWPDESAQGLLTGCESVIVVADPDIVRWTPQRAAAWRSLSAGRARLGLPPCLWLANQDARFDGRREWLRLLPERPLASIPLLPHAEWRALQYARRWATDHPAWRRTLEDALQPVIRSLLT